MGDEELSVEADEVKEMTLVHRRPPLHPLPKEIEKMDRSETVCLYCGISYLIYHEIHQLTSRLALLETELRELRGTAQREKAQREALELGRLEWERALNLELRRKAAEAAREGLEERKRDVERLLREELERKRREMDDREELLRRDLEERLTRQKEDLEKSGEERERVLSNALHAANKRLDELREDLQREEESRVMAVSRREEAEQLLSKETHQSDILRGVCVQRGKALRATLATLRSTGTELADVRGFLSQLTGTWHDFRSQILQHNTQVFSVVKEELRHSSDELKKTREEGERKTQQLMEERRRSQEQLSQHQHRDSEREHKILRLTAELKEKHERWLSCQQQCNTVQKQLSSWQQRGEQTNQKRWAAEEEVARLREDLEEVRQEARGLRKERDTLIDSHGRTLEEMETNFRQQLSLKLATALDKQRTQNALQLREQREKLCREAELELSIDREKNQLLLLQYTRDTTQLQQRLQQKEQDLASVREELQLERRSQAEQWRRREGELQRQLQDSHLQEALQLSQVKAQLQRSSEENADLQDEVTLLQETVRRECQEREELTAALCAAQVELLRLQRSPASHPAPSSTSPPSPPPPPGPSSPHRQTSPGRRNQTRGPLARSTTSPNTIQTTGRDEEEERRAWSFPTLRVGRAAGGGRTKTRKERR